MSCKCDYCEYRRSKQRSQLPRADEILKALIEKLKAKKANITGA